MRPTLPHLPHPSGRALAAVILAAGVGLADPAAAGAAPSPLPTASGRWVPVPGLVIARDINDRGDVLGYDRDFRPVVWSPRGGGRTTVVETPGAASVVDLTDDGTVVGYASPTGGPEPYGPFVWRADRGTTFVPQPANEALEVQAANDRGAVVGHVSVTRADIGRIDFHAYIWTATAGLRDIDPHHPFSTALAVNDRGVVTGSYLTGPDGPRRAYRWTERRGFEDLGHPDPSAFQDVAGVNDEGVIAVTVGDDQLGQVVGRVQLWHPAAPTR
jgi:hypothetical protein